MMFFVVDEILNFFLIQYLFKVAFIRVKKIWIRDEKAYNMKALLKQISV